MYQNQEISMNYQESRQIVEIKKGLTKGKELV